MTSVLAKEIHAFEAMQADLERDNFGKWVVFHDSQFIGAYPSFDQAAHEAVERFGRGPYLIRQVGEAPVTFPLSVLEALVPAHAD